ncbi:MAG: Uma2 family endonuclease [Saprospiraceae bacterium]
MKQNLPLAARRLKFKHALNADGMVVALPAEKFEYSPGMSAETSPILLVEVLSKSTRDYDFGIKLPCYKKIPALRQILFVEQSKPGVLAFERNRPNQWTETELKNLDDVFLVNDRPVALREIYAEVY